MIFCTKCGQQFGDDMRFCPNCGAPVSMPAGITAEANSQSIFYMEDITDQFDQADIEVNNRLSLLAYLSYLVLIPIFLVKNSRFARFHASQGLNIIIAQVAWTIATMITSFIFGLISPILGLVINVLLSLVHIAFVALMVIGIINAIKGKAKKLPLLGKVKILKY